MVQASYVPNAICVHIPDASRISSTNPIRAADQVDLSVHADLPVCLATLLSGDTARNASGAAELCRVHASLSEPVLEASWPLHHAEMQTEWRVA